MRQKLVGKMILGFATVGAVALVAASCIEAQNISIGKDQQPLVVGTLGPEACVKVDSVTCASKNEIACCPLEGDIYDEQRNCLRQAGGKDRVFGCGQEVCSTCWLADQRCYQLSGSGGRRILLVLEDSCDGDLLEKETGLVLCEGITAFDILSRNPSRCDP